MKRLDELTTPAVPRDESVDELTTPAVLRDESESEEHKQPNCCNTEKSAEFTEKNPKDQDIVSFWYVFKTYQMAKSEALLLLHKKESTILQWNYIAFIIVTFGGFFLILFFNGPGKEESVVGINRCDGIWWGMYAIIIVFALLMTALAIFQ